MPGAGTDKTKNWIETSGPIIVLVEPQLGENIGATARVMANFALNRLRLVKPRDGWPNIHARRGGQDERAIGDRRLQRVEQRRRFENAVGTGGGDRRLHARLGHHGARP